MTQLAGLCVLQRNLPERPAEFPCLTEEQLPSEVELQLEAEEPYFHALLVKQVDDDDQLQPVALPVKPLLLPQGPPVVLSTLAPCSSHHGWDGAGIYADRVSENGGADVTPANNHCLLHGSPLELAKEVAEVLLEEGRVVLAAQHLAQPWPQETW